MRIDYISWVIIAIVAAGAAYALYSIIKVKRNGMEVNAVVTRIEEHETVNSDGVFTDYDYYVQYYTQEGKWIEATLANPKNRLGIGSRIKIKYLPEREDYPVLTELLD